MFRWFRKLWIACTGWMWSRADALDENVHVIGATYDMADDELVGNIENVTRAVGNMIGENEKKVIQIEQLEKECEKLEQAMNGAEGLAKQRVATLKNQGKNKDEIEQDADYIRCRTGYQDAESTLQERRARIQALEDGVESGQKTIGLYQGELQSMTNRLDQLRREKSEHIADVESAKAMESANKMLAGISRSGVNKDLENIRRKRLEVRGRAKAAETLAGTDSKRATEEFVEFAQKQQAASKFDNLMEWGENEKSEDREASKLPE